ncbi:hypothetical protein PRZ48_005442 [Zasmidium cellare]|uniref:F-box domain-containing protein n=1 Tax=Zasmidium cellare TaxID=395010 RepID=A0ABR0ESE6_ZASCE|nr:hypothetical protein PRZ48_005442 [Zasmidium cellare]
MATPSPFLSLPKELRLLIYEQVYPPTPPPHLIDIIKEADPPTKSLLLTNRQIHHEAHALYKISFRTYWTTGKFMILHESAIPATSRDKIITSPYLREMQHITSLTLISTSPVPEESFIASMVHPNGGWKIVVRDTLALEERREE